MGQGSGGSGQKEEHLKNFSGHWGSRAGPVHSFQQIRRWLAIFFLSFWKMHHDSPHGVIYHCCGYDTILLGPLPVRGCMGERAGLRNRNKQSERERARTWCDIRQPDREKLRFRFKVLRLVNPFLSRYKEPNQKKAKEPHKERKKKNKWWNFPYILCLENAWPDTVSPTWSY